MPEERKHYRPSWDDYFMAIAKIIATRGTCNRLYPGSVLVKDKRIIATGYVGSPSGLPHCDDVGHLMEEGHCVRTIHSEHNVLLQVARHGGISTEDTTLYTTYSPCIHCCKYIVHCGVKRIVVGKIYRNRQAVDYLKEAGLQVDFYKENPKWKDELLKTFSEEIPEVRNEGEIKMEVKNE